MTPEERYLSRLQREGLKRGLQASKRGQLVAARTQDARIHAQQLTARSGRQLRILQADVDAGRASPDQVGLLWFVPGFSRVGGPDIVPPD